MPGKKNETKQMYTIVGIIALVSLTVFVMFLGYFIADRINPPIGSGVMNESTEIGLDRHYVFYRSYKVLSRGNVDLSNDDRVVFDFNRYALDGSRIKGETILHIDRDPLGLPGFEPVMNKIDEHIVLLKNKNAGDDSSCWVDASGKVIVRDFEKDILNNGLPSPDEKLLAYINSYDQVMVLYSTDGSIQNIYEIKTEDPELILKPIKWNNDNNSVFIKGVNPHSNNSLSLWELNINNGNLREINAIRDNNIKEFDINTEYGIVVGVKSDCNGNTDCKNINSVMYLINLITGEQKEMFFSNNVVYETPKLSPNGAHISYVIRRGDQRDVWVSDVNTAGHERRVISGKLLDWVPDGERIVVKRDGELQIVSINGIQITTIARESGTYEDQDFQGIDYIGIIRKK